MARITVEDCLQQIPNRFQLVLVATYRARMLSQGHAPKIESKNKPGVTALREVAEVINMHESTVSRVTNEKYVQTPRGVLPLKFFFSSALATASGEEASARSIRAKLQKMVSEEDSAKPLTDQQIVHLFQEQGIQIARRTVAKYRDQLGILPARMRKRV